MSENARKLALQRRMLISRHPRRANAQFAAENEHNPLVLQDCAECRGTGKRDIPSGDIRGKHTWTLTTCSACDGLGITGELEPYFTSDEEIRLPDADGWLRCPGCSTVFTTRDRDRWTGYRHKSCGQRIRVSGNDT